MPSPDLCTELEIAALVDQFYTRVRADPQLGPIFNARIEDWNHHLVKLCAFWSAILRGTAPTIKVNERRRFMYYALESA